MSDPAIPPMPMEPGKCFALSMSAEKYVDIVDTLGIYKIDEPIPEEILEDVETSPASEKWIKKKADRNCLSANPDDCLVWCLVKQDAEYASPEIKIDSIESRSYVILDARFQEEVGGQKIWKEVLCENRIPSNLVSDIQLALKARGYDAGLPDNQLNKKTSKMLVKFQQDNSLAYGQLDIETLQALGVIE